MNDKSKKYDFVFVPLYSIDTNFHVFLSDYYDYGPSKYELSGNIPIKMIIIAELEDDKFLLEAELFNCNKVNAAYVFQHSIPRKVSKQFCFATERECQKFICQQDSEMFNVGDLVFSMKSKSTYLISKITKKMLHIASTYSGSIDKVYKTDYVVISKVKNDIKT